MNPQKNKRPILFVIKSQKPRHLFNKMDLNKVREIKDKNLSAKTILIGLILIVGPGSVGGFKI